MTDLEKVRKIIEAYDNEPKKCPYCSRIGTVKQESSAEDILKEVDDMIAEGKA